MKPPARDIAVDALEDLWRNCESSDIGASTHFAKFCISDDDAKALTTKHLARWRPQVLDSESKPSPAPAPNGVQHPEDSNPTPSSAPSPAVKIEGEQMKKNHVGQAVAAAG